MPAGHTQTEQRILLVTGKGGVGKSMVAAAMALKLSREGKRTLLVELGDRSFYRYFFDRPVEYLPTVLRENLWVSRWDGESCLKEYLLHYIRIERVVNMFFENRIMKTLVQAAPALKELAILGKITSGIRNVGPALDYDYVVVDTYATGHFRALMQAPVGMGEAIKFGPMGEQSRSIQNTISNKDVCRTLIVTLPEELPVTETIELQQFLKSDFGFGATFLLNRMLKPPLTKQELHELATAAAGVPQGAKEFAAYLEATLDRQAKYRNQLCEWGSVQEQEMITIPSSLELVERISERMVNPWMN